MLVLSRKAGEKLTIGGGIVLTVVRIDNNQVRIGIEAPADIRVLRAELTDTPQAVDSLPEWRPAVAEACLVI